MWSGHIGGSKLPFPRPVIWLAKKVKTKKKKLPLLLHYSLSFLERTKQVGRRCCMPQEVEESFCNV
jgi:hypothetical protein